jgi:hypothetical protein
MSLQVGNRNDKNLQTFPDVASEETKALSYLSDQKKAWVAMEAAIAVGQSDWIPWCVLHGTASREPHVNSNNSKTQQNIWVRSPHGFGCVRSSDHCAGISDILTQTDTNILASDVPPVPLTFDCLRMAMGRGVAVFDLLHILQMLNVSQYSD